MTNRQVYILAKVREQINSIRMMLDDCMYSVQDRDQLSDEERSRIQEAYNYICKANDCL